MLIRDSRYHCMTLRCVARFMVARGRLVRHFFQETRGLTAFFKFGFESLTRAGGRDVRAPMGAKHRH